MTSLLDGWHDRARADPKRIVLADQGDDRAAAAANLLAEAGLAEPILIGRDLSSLAELDDPRVDAAAKALTTRLSARGRSVDMDDPLIIGALLVKAGWADACVAGATRPTGDVILAGVRVLGTVADVDVVSSSFFFVLPDGNPIVYGDCGVVPDPDVVQLASIAISSAATFEQLSGIDARVAMLSFSTKGSAQHAHVEKVREATREVRDRAPKLAVDGELQFDAAWVPAIAESKAPGSSVAGSANVFIFPNLDAGNIAYKITERLGGALAFGPLLQGLDGVMHDLSRGCSVDDIVNVAVIASLQASL